MTELRQHIGTDLNHIFMKGWYKQEIKHFDRCILLNCDIWLSFPKSSNDLGHSEPDVLTDIVTSKLNELDNNIQIPIQILSKFFC